MVNKGENKETVRSTTQGFTKITQNLKEQKQTAVRFRLTFIIRTFNSVFMLQVRHFLRQPSKSLHVFDNKHLYVMNQR